MDTHPVDDILSRHLQVTGNLITVLHEVQSHYNYLPQDVLYYLAKRTGIPVTRLYSIATFYHFFSLKPKGRQQIHVCTGTACHVKGAQRILDELERKLGVKAGETTPDMQFTINEVRCVGACSFAPVVVVGDQTYGEVNSRKIAEIIKRHQGDAPPPSAAAKPTAASRSRSSRHPGCGLPLHQRKSLHGTGGRGWSGPTCSKPFSRLWPKARPARHLRQEVRGTRSAAWVSAPRTLSSRSRSTAPPPAYQFVQAADGKPHH